ncbi:MAG: Holliday junction branch migration protein RuvA [Kiritimatiellae bacterium]|nr:Holliday junction branch migration protein RuvA [Kiritimatiellia bacterium]
MIVYIKGILAEKEPTRAVVEAAGVGYEMLIPLSTYDSLPKTGAEVKLLAYHCVREDDEILFGFHTPGERELFSRLTAVSGVGPKIALAILSGGSIGEISLAIASGNAKRLSSIKGVGKKTAEKICIELKDKVNAIEALAATQSKGGKGAASPVLRDAILALGALGFNEETANKMVSAALSANPEAKDVESVVRIALKGAK